jgi:hypothetical protein
MMYNGVNIVWKIPQATDQEVARIMTPQNQSFELPTCMVATSDSTREISFKAFLCPTKPSTEDQLTLTSGNYSFINVG